MIFSFSKKIVKEDFNKKDQSIIDKLGFIINPAFQQLASILSRNITWEDNIACVVKTITVTVDSTGKPTTTTSFLVDLKTTCQNLFVTRATNQTVSTHYPTAAPFVSWSQNGNTITINNVSGLQANEKYQLRIIITI